MDTKNKEPFQSGKQLKQKLKAESKLKSPTSK